MKIIGQWILILIIIYMSYLLVSSPTPWILLDNLNLAIHEAGHIIFLPFGEFMHILGGSLSQTLVPVAFVIYFFTKADFFAVSVMIFWVADNVINVSVYARDAQLMQLPLLGGDGTIHDWNWILTTTNLFSQTKLIANTLLYFGDLLLLISILGMIYFTVLKMKN